MATLVILMQQLLSAISTSQSRDRCSDSTMHSNLTNTTITQDISALASVPQDLPSFLDFLILFSALRDWLKLMVIGGFVESCRRLIFHLYHKLYSSFFINASFKENDDSYDWMMVWLSKHTLLSSTRDLQISTRSFGQGSASVVVPGEDEEPASTIHGNGRQISYLPSVSSTYSWWYKQRWMRITRHEQQASGYYGSTEETLQICIMTRTHKILNRLLLEAKKEYMASQEDTISIYVSDTSNNWRHVATRPKRPLESIFLDSGIKDLLIEDARDFLESKIWYSTRGIPFRRGYLLYGAPGSGMTSIIHSLAGELGLDVYIVSLSRTGLDDTSLSEIISELPEQCIALMEDIDAAFSQVMNRDAAEDQIAEQMQKKVNPNSNLPVASRISLSGLLNALDGVGAQEGRILFATTNKYSSLDPALCRPGHMDIHIEFKLASKYQIRELYQCFYQPASENYANKKGSVDSGYSSDEEDLIKLKTCSDASDTHHSSPALALSDTPTFIGNSHRARSPKLSNSQVSDLAAKFPDALPEREFSMAALQGYLMMYKTRPRDAVSNAAAWVECERAERATRTRKADTDTRIEPLSEKKDSTQKIADITG